MFNRDGRYDPRKDHMGALILTAFGWSKKERRTLGGIVEDTGLPRETVETYIKEHPKVIEMAPLSWGRIAVYRLKRNWKRLDETQGEELAQKTVKQEQPVGPPA